MAELAELRSGALVATVRKAMVSHARSAEVQKHAAMALWKVAHLSPKQQETIALEGCVREGEKWTCVGSRGRWKRPHLQTAHLTK